MYSWEESLDLQALKNKGTLAIDRAFYELVAAPKLQQAFPFHEDRIAVGLVGEGSECFGFDDEISRDHDFELGFCMWLTKEDYAEIGQKLSAFYLDLMEHEGRYFSEMVFGKDVSFSKDRVAGRRGVMEISRFYAGLLRLNFDLDKLIGQGYWQYAEPRFLATVTNGEVFKDDLGIFSEARQAILAYYPKKTWLLKLAEQLHLFSHGGQSNYPRMMARKDYVAAHICIDQTILAAMQIAYLLDKKFPPYYKWTRRGLTGLSILPSLSGLLEELALLPSQSAAWEGYTYSSAGINDSDRVIQKIEEIASLLVKELREQGLIDHTENFLESHVQTLVRKANLP